MRNATNYTEKANILGYRGQREQFEGIAAALDKESENVKNNLMYFHVFNVVKSILDSKPSVTNDLY
jgi:hypothetical protein